MPKDDTKRVMTFSNDNDYISFRHHVYVKAANQVELAEVGPRFEMRRKFLDLFILVVCQIEVLTPFFFIAYEIRLGTVDLTDADVEWQLASYTRTAAKRQAL